MAKRTKAEPESDAPEEEATAGTPKSDSTSSSSGRSARDIEYGRVQRIGRQFLKLGGKLAARPFSDDDGGPGEPNVLVIAELKSLAESL